MREPKAGMCRPHTHNGIHVKTATAAPPTFRANRMSNITQRIHLDAAPDPTPCRARIYRQFRACRPGQRPAAAPLPFACALNAISKYAKQGKRAPDSRAWSPMAPSMAYRGSRSHLMAHAAMLTHGMLTANPAYLF